MSESTHRGAVGTSAPMSFSTAGVPVDRRIELWENHNQDALIGLRCRTLSETALEATELTVRVDRIDLARVTGTSHVVERDEALIRRRPSDSVALYFALVGSAFYYHVDGVRTLRPGQLLICDADRPFLRGFSRGLEELVVKIPRRVFTATTGIGRCDEPRVVDFGIGGNVDAHTLAKAVGRAVRTDDRTAVHEQDVLDLVAAVTGNRHRGSTVEAHRIAAQTYIEQHLFEAGLSADGVAAGVGLSTRHLSRVFAASGTGFSRYVLQRRLEAARILLEKPAAGSMTIAEVAHRCGFASAAHFSGSFATHFGETASDVRRRAVATRAVPIRF